MNGSNSRPVSILHKPAPAIEMQTWPGRRNDRWFCSSHRIYLFLFIPLLLLFYLNFFRFCISRVYRLWHRRRRTT
jgi:hypothetical protein